MAKLDHHKFSFWKQCLFLIVPSILLFGIIEIGFRIAGYTPLTIERYVPYFSNAYFWISDQKLGFRNKPNGSHRFKLIKGDPLATTDKYGYRNGYHWHPQGKSPIVAFIGDSITFGAEVNDEQTGPSEVAKLLSQEFDVRVLNAAVLGYNTVQSKRMLEECLQRFSTIRVVIYVYCENDYYHNLNPLIYYPAQAPTVWWNDTKDKFLEMEINNPTVPWGEGFWVPDYIRQQSLRLQFTNYLRTKSVFLHQMGLRIRKLLGAKTFVVPNEGSNSSAPAEKQMLPRGSIGPVSTPQEIKEQERWAKEHGADKALEELLKQMQRICDKHGVVFLTTAFNRGKETSKTHDEFAVHCRQAGAKFISITEAFTDKPLSYSSLMSDGDYDPHYGPKGTKTFAKALFPELKAILSEMLVQK